MILQDLSGMVPATNIKTDEPMRKHTTFRTGGNASVYVMVDNGEQLSKLIPYLRKSAEPFFILGYGSNLLVSDAGYPGVIIKLQGVFDEVLVDGKHVIAGAGASMAKVAREAYENSLTGLEFASGIPGSIGGGIVMNAGAYDGEMKQVVEWVEVMDEAGEIHRLSNEQMQFGYRTSVAKKQPLVVCRASFLLQEGQKEQIGATMEELATKRREKQPLEYPSAGSTFKRPEGYFAGKLIMDAGLRGFSIGDARVSEKHCGFIVNVGVATSSEIYQLITIVRQKVEEQFGVVLEPEVIMLGEF